MKGAKVSVGFGEEAVYPGGTPVAQVAFEHEFGIRNQPEKPFMRRAARRVETDVQEITRKSGAGFDPFGVAEEVGDLMVKAVRREIDAEDLVATGQMRRSVRATVEDADDA